MIVFVVVLVLVYVSEPGLQRHLIVDNCMGQEQYLTWSDGLVRLIVPYCDWLESVTYLEGATEWSFRVLVPLPI